MADPFVAEIRIFPFNFAPKGWAFCDGQLLPISQNTALFSLLGTTYGGDGRSNFALPNIQGSVVMGPRQGPGLSDHDLGETSGSDTVTLISSETPPHTHTMKVSPDPGELATPGAGESLARSQGGMAWQTDSTNNLVAMAGQALGPLSGGDLPHNNLMPYVTLNYNIALQGVFPPRS